MSRLFSLLQSFCSLNIFLEFNLQSKISRFMYPLSLVLCLCAVVVTEYCYMFLMLPSLSAFFTYDVISRMCD